MEFNNILEKYIAGIKNKLSFVEYIYSFMSILYIYMWIKIK
ncbi:hypothetical protein CLLI_22030 [Clostridium liquoris]|jgi:hypothetical protein|uniref:Uncharacterized protein n=1 Tax=Clostridium liquoris TaxID=1289519 RepID=A0A2T0B1W5_9CLOT|nr:hypothetical protein CLLI_22030 [Clostridium liquoris]